MLEAEPNAGRGTRHEPKDGENPSVTVPVPGSKTH
jgi:hypothetical protein